jgi:tetratricopeptide (TPR) repeat protein
MKSLRPLLFILLLLGLLTISLAASGAFLRNVGLSRFLKVADWSEEKPCAFSVANDGDLANIKSILDKACSDNHVTPCRTLGFTLDAEGDDEQALTLWKIGSETTASMFLLRGQNLQETGNYGAALACFQKAADVDSDLRDVWYFMGSLQQETKAWEQALSSFEKAIECTQGRLIGISDAYFKVGVIRQHHIRPLDWDAAWQAYERAIAADDFRIGWLPQQTYIQRGNLLSWQERWARAVVEYKKALELNDRSLRVRKALADAYVQKGDFSKAESVLREAVVLAPRSSEAYAALGDFYRDADALESAIEAYAEALRLDLDNVEIQNTLRELQNSVKE